jgi:hypothetical protein
VGGTSDGTVATRRAPPDGQIAREQLAQAIGKDERTIHRWSGLGWHPR